MLKALIIFCSLALICGLGIAIFPIRQKDYATYEALLKSSRPEENTSTALSYSRQRREGVRKHIWYQDDSPLYFRIDSQESELFFFRQDHQVEIIEQLGEVACVMQEELYYEEGKPMQRIRYLEAQKASYNYNSHLFIAEGVKLWKYHLEGHELPVEFAEAAPVMRATAHSVEFTLKGEKLDFTAHHMRAIVNTKEKTL